MIPEYRQSPTMTQAAGVVIVRFVIALMSMLSAFVLYNQAREFPQRHYSPGDMFGFFSTAIVMSAWSVATLFVVACLQNWLGKIQLRITLKWSIAAGAVYPIFSWLLMNFADIWIYGFATGIALFIIYPIVWGYIAFKSPELPQGWRELK